MRNNKLILQKQQRFKSQRHNKIALSSNINKRMQSVHSIETYVYEMRKDLVSEKKIINVTI